MNLLRTYIAPRIVQWVLVIFIGITATFLIPRLSPINPVDEILARMTAFQTMDPEAFKVMRESTLALYGLDKTLVEQYFAFWGACCRATWVPRLAISRGPLSISLRPRCPGRSGY